MGHKDEALETLKKAQEMFREMGMVYYWLRRTQRGTGNTISGLEYLLTYVWSG